MSPEQSEKIFLSIEHATVRYLDKVIFPELTFVLHSGEHWAVTGKSGSGKTALLNTILGKYNIVNGYVHYSFYDNFLQKNRMRDHHFSPRKLMSMVSFQPHFKNKQNMADFYYQQRFHAWDSEDTIIVQEYLQQAISKADLLVKSGETRFPLAWVINHLNLKSLLTKTLIQLSNGETRRLLIAHALLQQPLLLLLDNPFTGLDASTRVFFHELLTQIVAKGARLMLVTPPQEIPDCITNVLELEDGKIAGQWTRQEFLQYYRKKNNTSLWQPDPDKLQKVLQKHYETMPFENTVKLRDIHVKYGDTIILDHVNWKIKKGEKWALLGPNGAGKSTLLSLLTGDNPQAYANDISLFDKKRGSGESIWEVKQKIGFVSPELHQYFPYNSTCLEVIYSGYTDTMIPIRKKLSDEQKAHASDWLDLLGIISLKDRPFKYISAGEQRLILLVRALIKHPPLLILDEPCQGLDQEQKDHFKNIIDHLCEDREQTLIYVTHYKEEIPASVNKVLQLEKGKVLR